MKDGVAQNCTEDTKGPSKDDAKYLALAVQGHVKVKGLSLLDSGKAGVLVCDLATW